MALLNSRSLWEASPTANPHFVGRFAPQSYARPNYLFTPQDLPGPEANPHWIGRFVATKHTLLGLLWQQQDWSTSTVVTAQVEAQPHFLGRFTPYNFSIIAPFGGANDSSSSAVETNQNSIATFRPPQYNILPLLRQQQDWASSTTVVVQPETNTHFLGKFNQPQFSRGFLYNTQASDTSSSAVETNTHFIAKFTQPIYARFNYNTAAFDFSSSAVETNPHFVPHFTPALHRVLQGLRQNIAADTSSSAVETNQHFIPRFLQPQFARFNYQNQAIDVPPVISAIETNVHFVPRYTPVRHFLLPLLRSNIAADTSSSAVETNVSFLGRFTPARISIWSGLYYQTPQDLSGPPPIPPIVPIPATYYMLEDHWINQQYLPAGTVQTTADLGGPLPINWVPTPNVDPVDANAVAAYSSAGFRPRGLTRAQFTPLPVRQPNYDWQIINNEPVLVKVRNNF